MVVLCDFFRRTCGFDAGKKSVKQLGCRVMNVCLSEAVDETEVRMLSGRCEARNVQQLRALFDRQNAVDGNSSIGICDVVI